MKWQRDVRLFWRQENQSNFQTLNKKKLIRVAKQGLLIFSCSKNKKKLIRTRSTFQGSHSMEQIEQMEQIEGVPSAQAVPNLISSFLDDPRTTKLHANHNTSVHLAVLVLRGKIIATASNRVGTRSRGSGFSNMTIHAEVNVVKSLGDNTKIKGCDLYVMRIPKESKKGDGFMSSKPCHSCEKFLTKCMKEYGLNNVYYTQ